MGALTDGPACAFVVDEGAMVEIIGVELQMAGAGGG